MKKGLKRQMLFAAVLSQLIGCLFLIVFLLIRYTENDRTGETAENMPEETSETAAQEASSVIRVCLRNDYYEKVLHDNLSIASDAPWVLFGEKSDRADSDSRKEIRRFEKQEIFSVSAKDFPCGFHLIAVSLTDEAFYFPGLKRDISRPKYEGKVHLYVEKDGLQVVNEVELETYLKSVVAGEMPSSFPLEAQKAQAVCARTYAIHAMEAQKNKNSFSDLDDSTAFQVYNNQQVSEISAQAVEETSGEILPLAGVQYYSTAYIPGVGDGKNFTEEPDLSTEEAFAASLEEVPDENAEYGSPWLRWNVGVSETAILEQLRERSYEVLSSLDRIEVTKRTSSGQASQLLLCGNGKKVYVNGEYEIRAVLSPRGTSVNLQNGQEITGLSLLPSAWICIIQYDTSSGELFLHGGGYGHGIGMSQCGAAAMAADGAGYLKILDYYYGESELEHVKNL